MLLTEYLNQLTLLVGIDVVLKPYDSMFSNF
jgi:hypothetical protein